MVFWWRDLVLKQEITKIINFYRNNYCAKTHLTPLILPFSIVYSKSLSCASVVTSSVLVVVNSLWTRHQELLTPSKAGKREQSTQYQHPLYVPLGSQNRAFFLHIFIFAYWSVLSTLEVWGLIELAPTYTALGQSWTVPSLGLGSLTFNYMFIFFLLFKGISLPYVIVVILNCPLIHLRPWHLLVSIMHWFEWVNYIKISLLCYVPGLWWWIVQFCLPLPLNSLMKIIGIVSGLRQLSYCLNPETGKHGMRCKACWLKVLSTEHRVCCGFLFVSVSLHMINPFLFQSGRAGKLMKADSILISIATPSSNTWVRHPHLLGMLSLMCVCTCVFVWRLWNSFTVRGVPMSRYFNSGRLRLVVFCTCPILQYRPLLPTLLAAHHNKVYSLDGFVDLCTVNVL